MTTEGPEARIRHQPLGDRVREMAAIAHLGGPAATFERDGRRVFIALIRAGLAPDTAVIDVGCGALRVGYWLIHFLEPGGYHGIDPGRRRLDAARRIILEPGVEAVKRPAFAYNSDWDLTVFGVTPDLVIARSIWSHAPKRSIMALLDSFAAVAGPSSRLVASYVPAREASARWWAEYVMSTTARVLHRASHRAPSAHPAIPRARQDFAGDGWNGQQDGRLVAHRYSWIQSACSSRGLCIRHLPDDDFGGQRWLEIAPRPPQARQAEVRDLRRLAKG